MKIGIVMGSKSDFDIVKKGLDILDEFDIDVEIRVLSAHRTLEETLSFAKNAYENEIELIIAAAGKAAHLPGIIAAATTMPVIGLPIKASEMDGLDSLLSIVQMPKGIPVATVAINGSENAALLAIEILAVKYNELRVKLEKYREKMKDSVLSDNEKIMELYKK